MADQTGNKGNPRPKPRINPLRLARKQVHKIAFDDFLFNGDTGPRTSGLYPGQEFYVHNSKDVMWFGSDRKEDAKGDRPAILLRHYGQQVWLGLPGTSHNMSKSPLFFGTDNFSYSYWKVSQPPGSFFFYQYELVSGAVLRVLKGQLKEEKFQQMRYWLEDRFHPLQ